MEATTIRPRQVAEPKLSAEDKLWRSRPETAIAEAQKAYDTAKRRLVETKNAQAALDRIDPKALHDALMEARPPFNGAFDLNVAVPPSETLLRFTIALARRRLKVVEMSVSEVGG